jgi:large subunit ribosomal protein L4
LKAKEIKVVEAFSASEFKTKKIVEMIDKIGAEGSVLITAPKLDTKFIASARNISGVQMLSVKQLNVAAILDADAILIDTEGLKELEVWLGKTKSAARKEAEKSGDKK